MAVEKTEWLVIAPDIPGALEKRMAVRATHMAMMKEAGKIDDIVFGGTWTPDRAHASLRRS